MTNVRGLLVLSLLLTCEVHAGPAMVEEYDVNVQYRGGVVKSFAEMGSCKASYQLVGENVFEVRLKGLVRHPEEPKIYEFKVGQTFAQEGDSIRMTFQRNLEFNDHARAHEERITEVVPFAFLARQLPSNQGGVPLQDRSLNLRGHVYVLRYVQAEGQTEVSLYRDESLRGKFFLVPGTNPKFADLVKFRVSLPEEQLVVTFVNKVPPRGSATATLTRKD